MQEYVTIFFEIVISVAIAVAFRYGIPYIKALTEDVRLATILNIIQSEVEAAEERIKEKGQGKAKKAEVITFVTNWLRDKKINVTQDMISRWIDAAVRTMNKEMGKYKED